MTLYHHSRTVYQSELVRECRKCRTVKPIDQFRHVNGKPREHTCRSCLVKQVDACHKRKWADRQAYQREYQRKLRVRKRIARALTSGDPRAWWSVTRASVELGIYPQYVRRLCASGRLVAVRGKVGLRHYGWLIDPASVRRYDRARYTDIEG